MRALAIILFITASAVGSACRGQSSTAAPPDLAAAVANYDRATIRKDIAALSRIVTDDYMLVNSDATVQDKASYLADFRVPGFTIAPYRLTNPTFKSLGDVALTGGEMDLSWAIDGRRQTRHLRITHVWVRRDNGWHITFTQLTRAIGDY
jgi:ketosteroid isomerase-like protein